MSQTSILLPAFAHVLLTIAVMIVMGMRRSASMREKGHTFKDVALGQDVWNEAATKAARNYANQFEMPVLFHAACAMALAAKAVDSDLGLPRLGVHRGPRGAHGHPSRQQQRSDHEPSPSSSARLIVLAMWIVLVLRAAT